MVEVAGGRAAPLAEPTTPRLDTLEQAPAAVYCECSVCSLGSRYLNEAELFGIHLHDFDKDLSTFQCITAPDAQCPEQQAELERRKKKLKLSAPKRVWAQR